MFISVLSGSIFFWLCQIVELQSGELPYGAGNRTHFLEE